MTKYKPARFPPPPPQKKSFLNLKFLLNNLELFPYFGIGLNFVESCVSGSYYNLTTGFCQQCPLGYFQENSGNFHCSPCNVDKSTAYIGSKQRSSCVGMYIVHVYWCMIFENTWIYIDIEKILQLQIFFSITYAIIYVT